MGCRRTCGNCTALSNVLRLLPRDAHSAAFAAGSSFQLEEPARRAYPQNAFVLAAANRHYLVAPLGNLIDERYTAHFLVKAQPPRAGGGGGSMSRWVGAQQQQEEVR